MTTQLPLEILQKAVKLRNCTKNIYIALYCLHKPTQCTELAKIVEHARAYTNMRLNTLVDMGLVKKTRQGRKFFFEVITT